MGTTLTGTTPQDTYDSLIKVTDNGPLSATAKYLSDGLGNDSVLALSTTAVGIGTTSGTSKANILSATVAQTVLTLEGNYAGSGSVELLEFNRSGGAVSGAIKYQDADTAMSIGTTTSHAFLFNTGDTERMRISSSGNVGIGSAAATGARLESVVSSAGASPTVALRLQNTGAAYQAKMVLTDGNTNDGNIVYQGGFTGDTQYIGFGVGAAVNDVQVTASKYLRMASGTGGIQFNGDTAAANALDDYEEGTWTMGISFGGASVGVTYSSNTGTYTKIGRQVTVNGYLNISNKGSSTGDARITGLPFTIPNANSSFSAASIWFADVTFANQFQGYGLINTNTMDLREITILGVGSALTNADFANNSQVILSLTYFV